jgi:hypothetical protein
MIVLNKMKQIQGRGFRLKVTIVFLTMLCVLSSASCKKDDTGATPKEEKDAGIHEEVDRGPATVTLDVDRKEISIAERLNLTISITVDEDHDIKLPGFGEKLEQFGIVDYRTTQPELIEGNRKKVSRSYVLEPFLSGDYTIPPMVIKFWKKGDQEAEEHKIETSEVTVKVKSLLPEDLKDVSLNEIKPPVPFPRSYIPWIWAVIAAAVLVTGIVTTTVIVRKRRKAEGEGPGLKIPAHELAYEALKRLVEEDLPGKGEIKLFYQRISAILRRYIENRFGLRAPEQTTEEFLFGLENAPDFPDNYKTLLKKFLNHCDLVKFAEYQPGIEDIQNTFNSCRSFIEGTEERE